MSHMSPPSEAVLSQPNDSQKDFREEMCGIHLDETSLRLFFQDKLAASGTFL